MKRIAEWIVIKLLKADVISDSETDVYVYGMHVLLNNIVDVGSIILISLLFNCFLPSIVYHVAFIPLRQFGGGYHSKTHLRCFLFSTAVWLFSMLVMHFLVDPLIYVLLSAVSCAVIWAFCPIEHADNPLSRNRYEKARYFSRLCATFLLLVILVVAFFVPTFPVWIMGSAALGQASHALLVVMAVIEKRMEKSKENALESKRP